MSSNKNTKQIKEKIDLKELNFLANQKIKEELNKIKKMYVLSLFFKYILI